MQRSCLLALILVPLKNTNRFIWKYRHNKHTLKIDKEYIDIRRLHYYMLAIQKLHY